MNNSILFKRLAVALIILSVFTSAFSMNENPLFKASTLPFEAPHFDKIKIEHYMPAFEEGMKLHAVEVGKIADNKEEPTFENTIVALETSGDLISRVQNVFFNLTSAHTSEELQKIQMDIMPKLTEHYDNILLNASLFARIESLYKDRKSLDLEQASLKLLEDTHRDFIRAGAMLTEEQKEQMREINKELSSLTTEFQQNLLAIYKERVVWVDDKEKLAGLSEDRISSAAAAAKEQGDSAKFLIQVSNTTRVPILKSLDNREVRQQVWEASAYRGIGENDGIDNRPLVLKMVKLRAEKAELLGYDNYASYVLEPQMAQSPDNAMNMLTDMIPALLVNSQGEAAYIEKMMKKDGIDGPVKSWDWEYYAEKVRMAEYTIDEDVVREYFELEKVLKDGVFYTMNRLFGITFEERFDIPVYQEDVRVFNVYDDKGEHIALFYADYYARESKRGGAWMSSYVDQSGLLDKKPVIVNVMNIPKPSEGEPALISFDNTTTMFHEMGHGVHGLLSQVKYPSQSGTSVPRDFVEFPSTFQEDWAIEPEVLENYAVHYKTGERIPQELLDKLVAARGFNQGFDTQEYLAAAILDMEWHLLSVNEIPENVEEFETKALAKHKLNVEAIPPRYKSPFFAHIFAGGYSANYYAYMWSEVLAADAFAYMQENGGLTAEYGHKFQESILSKGGTKEAMKLYENFRGKQPDVKHLLIRRGLNAE